MHKEILCSPTRGSYLYTLHTLHNAAAAAADFYVRIVAVLVAAVVPASIPISIFVCVSSCFVYKHSGKSAAAAVTKIEKLFLSPQKYKVITAATTAPLPPPVAHLFLYTRHRHHLPTKKNK